MKVGILRLARFSIVSILVVFLAGSLALAAKRPIKFENKTGDIVNDLHIEFVNACTAIDQGAFVGVSGEGTTSHMYDYGTVPAGGSTTLVFQSTSPKIEMKRWYWTKDGVKVSPYQYEKKAATANVDKEVAMVGDQASLSATVYANPYEPANMEIIWNFIDPNGMPIFQGSMMLVTMPPQIKVITQIWEGIYDMPGLYELHWTSVNHDNGEALDGSGEIMVNF